MRVLLVVDYSPRSDRAVAEFAQRRWPPGTIVRVLSVVENVPPSAAELWFDAGGSLEAVSTARKERSEDLVANVAGLLRANGFAAETAVREGRRHQTIAIEAKAWPADMVVFAYQGLPAANKAEGSAP